MGIPILYFFYVTIFYMRIVSCCRAYRWYVQTANLQLVACNKDLDQGSHSPSWLDYVCNTN